MVRFHFIAVSFFLVLLSGCGTGSSVKNTDNAQSGIGQNVKEAKQTKVAEPGSSTRSISLDDLLGNYSPNSGPKVVSNSGPWKYYTGPDGTSRQDISGVEWVVLEGGQGTLLTQAMVSQELRRYVIKESFDLGGKTIKMPYGSVLDLESGDLRNGTIVFDDTRVTPVYAISKQNKVSKVKVSGTYYETLVDLWGASAEPVFPWDTTPPKKIYTVDLKKFGITPGYQKKGSNGHYSDKQYDLMYKNGVGFTYAIQWAYKNGYDGIRFPKNDYCFTPRTVGKENSPLCGQVLVQDLEKFDIDLGGGSYYNILDSSRKSKYYKDGTEAYNQQSYMFFLAACLNVSIHNGNLIGDRKLRDYPDAKARNVEHTYGIEVSGYCYNIRIHHIDASGFMGDGITMQQQGDYFKSYDSRYSPVGVEYATISKPTKLLESGSRIKKASTNNERCTVTEYMDFSGWYPEDMKVPKMLKDAKLFSVNNNRGYTRIPNIYSNVDILTFDKSKSTENPIRIIKSSYLSPIKLEKNETGIKYQFYYDEGVGQEGFQHNAAISDLIVSDCVIEYCNIHDNHRGGISGGCNNTVIRNCTFSKNDTEKNYAGKTIPVFSVGATNYHIDYEDCFAKNLEVYGCRFSSSGEYVGRLLFGVFTLDFHDNVTNNPVIVYNNIRTSIHNNVFTGKCLGLSNWFLSNNKDYQTKLGSKYLTRVICVFDNSITQSVQNFNDHNTFIYSFNNKKR